MKRAQLNLVLLVLVAGLGVGIWFSQEEEEKGPPLTPHTAATLNDILIEHPDRKAIRLKKADGQWRLVEPVQSAVDPFEINGLLDLAEREARQTLEVGEVKLAELGLKPPSYSISLNGTKVEFGGVEPLNYRRYVKVGPQVSLIDDPPSAALDADYHDLLSKKLLGDGAKIERVEVPGLVLSKDADGKWQLEPADAGATTDRMQKLADGWANANAMWNEMPGEGEPTGEPVKITLQGGEERTFLVAQREPQFKLYSPSAGVNHVLSKSLAEELLQLPEIPEPEPQSEDPRPDDSGDEPTESEPGL